MIIYKENGTSIQAVLKEHLEFLIRRGWRLASINRALTINSDTLEYVDDITLGEIQAGTALVKDYCLSNNELDLLKQYLPLVLSDTELLTELKAIKLIEINNAYETAVLSVQREHIPQTEMLSFEIQERESKAYKDSGYTDTSLCPFMQSIANARGVDLKALCDKALEKATLYRQASGMLIGKRQGLQDRIEQVQTKEDLEDISWK